MTHSGHTVLPQHRLSRRQFLRLAGSLGLSAAGLSLLEACGVRSTATTAATSAAAAPLETTTIRISVGNTVSICIAPLIAAESFLRAEGFNNVQYVTSSLPTLTGAALAADAGDMTLQYSGPTIQYLDTGKPITMLAGIHIGCFVLFGSAAIRNIGDLKGKTLAVSQIGGADHVFLSAILANVNIDPNHDVGWVAVTPAETKQRFIAGQIDAILAFPPAAQELEDSHVGHVLVNSMMDKPWSEYYCCMATFRQAYVQQYPVATKRALRALLNATDATANHPETTAKLLVDKGITRQYDYALQAMREIPYDRWRLYKPEDTIRFYALKLRDVGMITKTPEDIIKLGTDWHFLDELRAEMTATPAPAGFASARNLLCAIDDSRVAGAQPARSAE
jgi:NitT/TauT family transport system substrate-binding protein